MLWVVHCLDRAGVLDLRQAVRQEHSARLRSGVVEPVLYGVLVAADGHTPVGSLIVLRAPDRETVERYVADDPFTTNGIWQQVTVTAFVESANSPVSIVEKKSQ